MSKGAEDAWVDHANWRERWAVIEKLKGGGQGDAFKVRRVTDGQVAFLKTIKARTDPERRARFSREANAYDTFRVPGVPALIESNAHRHKHATVEPYIATEFIRGPTLRTWRKAQSRVDLPVAAVIARVLLSTLRDCHRAGCVHRDVKPDNIILADADPTKVALLDFGLNFHDAPDIDFRTEHWQEIGNRFLRLPELSAGSFLKQDPRSDLSFVSGILFYVLTGEHPDVLQDAEGRLPHQRRRALAVLHDVAGIRHARLAALFDSTFTPQIADRLGSADSMLASMDRMMENREGARSEEDDLAAILEIVDSDAARRRVATTVRLGEALRQVSAVHDEVARLMRGSLVTFQTGYGITGEIGANTLGWMRPGTDETVVSTAIEARQTGDEIVIRMSGEAVFRTPVAAPTYGENFRQAVRSWLLARIRAAVSDPDALPPEADLLIGMRPIARLADAVEEARRTGRRILAFVYDPAEIGRSKLRHGLGHFLQNRKTRETIAAAFVVALVPVSQVSARSEALKGLSMEESRWIVFDSDLNPLEEAVVYANPQEGERIAHDLAQRFSS